MSELSNYSIETDQTVLLSFKDGRSMRVPVGQMSRHLAPSDLGKVQAAVKLRQRFISQHMPKVVIVLVIGGLFALLVVGRQAVALLWHHPAATPEHTRIVRSLDTPTPSISPPPQPSGPSTAVATKPRRLRLVARSASPVAASVALAAAIQTPPPAAPQPSAAPVPILDAAPAGNEPSPTPTPTPTPQPSPPPPGQVLGDSTGPVPPAN